MASDTTKSPTPKESPNSTISAYLSEHIPEYRELVTLKQQGWRNSSASEYFQSLKGNADRPTEQGKKLFYKMTCRIGEDLHVATDVLALSAPEGGNVAALDLCMAPGGFTAATLAHNPGARVCGITLPISLGGYEVRIPKWKKRTEIEFLDITMLATEMGVDIDSEIAANHPDFGRRPEYRASCEALRLWTSQLVLALGRVRQGGTLVVLMHRADDWHTVHLMHLFNSIANLQLFKPKKAHAKRSSFYMVARNVQPQSETALKAIEQWKKQWRSATLLTNIDCDTEKTTNTVGNHIESVLSDSGETLVAPSTPVFRIQAHALRTAEWNKPGKQ